MWQKPAASDECRVSTSLVGLQQQCVETGGSTLYWNTTRTHT